jgi:hypothetical protein
MIKKMGAASLFLAYLVFGITGLISGPNAFRVPEIYHEIVTHETYEQLKAKYAACSAHCKAEHDFCIRQRDPKCEYACCDGDQKRCLAKCGPQVRDHRSK